MILPSAYDAPRFTSSQHALPNENGLTGGAKIHFTAGPGLVRSNAISLSGNAVTMYSVLPTTSGCPSCPSRIPSSYFQTSASFDTFDVSIVVSGLKRVAPYVRPGRT